MNIIKDFIKKYFFIFLLTIIFPICIPIITVANSQEEFISVEEIYPGMKGIGKTVFSGTKIEDFDVEVIDVIYGTGVNYPYILVKLSGEKIDNNGGISAGMSGSPVYLDGRLAGAISHAWEMSEHNLCLITPIGAMLNLFDYIQNGNKDIYSNSFLPNNDNVSIPLDGLLQGKLDNSKSRFKKTNNISTENQDMELNFRYLQSPLLISGLDGRASEYVTDLLKKQNIVFLQNIPEYQNIKKELEISSYMKELEPGSAIGVQLSTGDISIIGIGTVTYGRDDYLLSFGHPFLHHGDVSYLFSSVYIYHSFPSIIMPFKIGSPYLLLGEVIQDRSAGILAKLNHFPHIISCQIKVCDLDRDLEMTSAAKIVSQKEIVGSIIPAFLIQSVDNTIDRIGQGTALVQLDMRNAKTGNYLSHKNMFFSEGDIAIQCSKDFNELFDLLSYNFTEKIELSEIKFNITIKEQDQRALIKEVKLGKTEYNPGDNLEAKVTIQPFRQSDEQELIKIELPNDIKSGNALLIVKGGASKEEIRDKTVSQNDSPYLLNGWNEIQTYIEKKEKNNQIIAELILFSESEKTDQSGSSDKKDLENNLKVILDTDFVIDGYHEIFFNIKNKEKSE